jgi:signal transduction histidine kinase
MSIRPRLPVPTIRRRLTLIYGGLFALSGAALLAITYVLVRQATSGTSCYSVSRGSDVCVNGTALGGPHSTITTTRGNVAGLTSSPEQLKSLANGQHAAMLHQLAIQSAIALGIMLVASLVLGWIIAGRVVRPIRIITQTAQNISATSLHERLAVTGPDDELKKLGDTIDALLARLEAAFEAQRHFTANASHELRTPLTVMRAVMQMTLSDPSATTETFQAACRDVLTEGEHAERMLEALLVLARSERGLDHREPFDLADIAAQVLRARAAEAARLGLRIGTAIAPAPADGDPRLAERLVANLVDNALWHNVPGGQVEVSTGTESGQSFISVVNTGPEIPPDAVDLLFQPFHRLAAGSPGHSGGLGLGLSIVQAIARAHHADLAVWTRRGGGLHARAAFHRAQLHPPRSSPDTKSMITQSGEGKLRKPASSEIPVSLTAPGPSGSTRPT